MSLKIATSTELQMIYPAFVMHKHWDMPPGYNDRLYALAAEDADANRIQDKDDDRNIGDQTNHLGHLRHNFLMDRRDPAIAVLAQMVAAAVREYLQLAYGYDYAGDIQMMADTFWQRRAAGENVGINMHTHIQSDIVCTYYPRVMLDADCPKTSLHRGAVRFYDPANVGKRLWPCRNPDAYIGGWYAVEPQTGSMVIFEGHVPHDSTYFEGHERMCISVLCSLFLPNSHCKAGLSEILAHQTTGDPHGV
jgi:hypothetical protein